MATTSTQRPPQVTLAGSVVIVASVLVVLTVWEYVSSLRSLESRAGIERFLEQPTGRGLGLDVERAIGLLHVSGMVAAGCATATAILGWYVLRRDTSARLALGVLAVPLFVTGLLVNSFASSFVAAAAAMLWLSPAREWFATGQWTPPPTRGSRAAEQERRDVRQPPASPSAPPRPSPASADPVHPRTAAAHERPAAVVTALVLTTTLSVLVALLTVLAMVVVGMSPELVVDEFERQWPDLADGGTTLRQLRVATFATGAFYLLLCALALVFAGFLTAGREWARRGLMVTSALCAGACILAAPFALVAVVPAGAAMATVMLLARPETRAWCRDGRGSQRHG